MLAIRQAPESSYRPHDHLFPKCSHIQSSKKSNRLRRATSNVRHMATGGGSLNVLSIFSDLWNISSYISKEDHVASNSKYRAGRYNLSFVSLLAFP